MLYKLRLIGSKASYRSVINIGEVQLNIITLANIFASMLTKWRG